MLAAEQSEQSEDDEPGLAPLNEWYSASQMLYQFYCGEDSDARYTEPGASKICLVSHVT